MVSVISRSWRAVQQSGEGHLPASLERDELAPVEATGRPFLAELLRGQEEDVGEAVGLLLERGVAWLRMLAMHHQVSELVRCVEA